MSVLEKYLTDTYGTEVLRDLAADWPTIGASVVAEVAGPETTQLRRAGIVYVPALGGQAYNADCCLNGSLAEREGLVRLPDPEATR